MKPSLRLPDNSDHFTADIFDNHDEKEEDDDHGEDGDDDDDDD